MVGQGSPIVRADSRSRISVPFQRAVIGRIMGCAVGVLVCWLGVISIGHSEETTVRLRLAWGSGGEARQRWTGSIAIEGGELSDLQPLGIEVDAPVGLRIADERLLVVPQVKRGYDGCDITIQADEEALVRIELQSETSPDSALIEVTLKEILQEQLRESLDEQGSFFLAHRAPGDQLRVVLSRDHLVFNPEERWSLQLEPDLKEVLTAEPALLEIQMHAAGGKEVLWQAGRQIASEDQGKIEFEIECPAEEGAYRLTITARTPEGLATRFVPGQHGDVLASREVEFVVVDPAKKLPVLTESWKQVLAIDPANPSWWQRLPSWTQTARISGRAAESSGNVRPVVRMTAEGKIVELPAATINGEPNWQSYTLPVRETGVPHLVELQYPLDQEQQFEISVIEPNAAGQVLRIGGGSGLYSNGESYSVAGEMGSHRLMFWPRTRSPQLLIVNRHAKTPAQYGTIKLLQHDSDGDIASETPIATGTARLVAGYISKPSFAENFGVAEMVDARSGLSVQSWSTFLDGANRLAQYLRYSGNNTVMLSVTADGSALYPSKVLRPSPRYDTGMLASSGQDPLRKDVLEMLLRVFDREGIQIVPTVQLTAPLPALERLRLSTNSQQTGIACIGPRSASWLQENPETSGQAPHYNLLNQQVQAGIREMVAELPQRYGKHKSLAGVAMQLSGEGYGLLPGLAWGLDDTTVAAFTRETGIAIEGDVSARFYDRAQQLLGPHRQKWVAWRAQQITQFYAQLAQDIQNKHPGFQLVLTTEDLFSGSVLQRRVRHSLVEPVRLSQVLLEHGIDLAQLNAAPALIALPPHRLAAGDGLQDRAIDLRINSATEQGELILTGERTGSLFHHASLYGQLRSFDQRSPFGPERTQLSLTNQSLPAGALARRHLIKTLARHDCFTYVEGGESLPLAQPLPTREILRTIQQLPGPDTPSRTRSKQPVTLRIYRSTDSTTFAVMNESPWSVTVQLPLKTSELCNWRRLGKPQDATENAGQLSTESEAWEIELKPYDLQAWQFDSATVRMGELQVSMPEMVAKSLKQRIEEIESRTGNLNIERPYPQLLNPGFEFGEGDASLTGWQPRIGAAGTVEVDRKRSHSGARAVRLRSEDRTGVAVQSNLFPLPETGQLVVSAHLKGVEVPADARLYIILEDENNGRVYREYATLGDDRKIDSEWARYEFPVDDLPLNSASEMHVQFYLTGKAEVLIDDVQLHDLRFNKARRGALVKRVYAAKTALDSGDVTDCLRLVDEYWSRYLVEYVPTFKTEAVQVAKQPAAPVVEPEDQEEEGFGSRLPGWVPRLWR